MYLIHTSRALAAVDACRDSIRDDSWQVSGISEQEIVIYKQVKTAHVASMAGIG